MKSTPEKTQQTLVNAIFDTHYLPLTTPRLIARYSFPLYAQETRATYPTYHQSTQHIGHYSSMSDTPPDNYLEKARKLDAQRTNWQAHPALPGVFVRPLATDDQGKPLAPSRRIEDIPVQSYGKLPENLMHGSWTQEQRDKINHAYQLAQMMSKLQAGNDPYTAALPVDVVNKALREGHLSIARMAAGLQVAEDAKNDPRMTSASYQKRMAAANTPVEPSKAGQMRTDISFENLPTKSAFQAEMAAKAQRNKDLQAKLAQLTKKSVEEIGQRFRPFTPNQLGFFNPIVKSFVGVAGPGTGKTESNAASVVYHSNNLRTDLRDFIPTKGGSIKRNRSAVLLSATHDAKKEYADKVARHRDLIPGLRDDPKAGINALTPYALAMSTMYKREPDGHGGFTHAIDSTKYAGYTLLGADQGTAKGMDDQWIGDIDEKAKGSQKAFVEQLLKYYGIKGVDTNKAMEYISGVKSDTIADRGITYNALLDAGRKLVETSPQRFKATSSEKGVQAGALYERDMPALLYLYQQAMTKAPGYVLPGRENEPKHFDLQETIPMAHHMYTNASSFGLTPYKFIGVDEMQDLSPNMVQLVGAMSDTNTRVVATGDPSQKNILDKFDVAKHLMKVLEEKHANLQKKIELVESWRHSPADANVANALLSTRATEGYPMPPFIVSVRDMPANEPYGVAPKHMYAQTHTQLYKQGFHDWMNRVGLSPETIRMNTQMGQHPFSGASYTEQTPFLFQQKDQRKDFAKVLYSEMKRILGHDVDKHWGSIYSDKLPSDQNKGALYALLTSQAKGRGFAYPYADTTAVGQWDEAGHAFQQYILQSRTQYDTQYGGGQLTLMGFSHPTEWSKNHDNSPYVVPSTGEQLPHNANTQLAFMIKNGIEQQGVPLQWFRDQYGPELVDMLMQNPTYGMTPAMTGNVEDDPRAREVLDFAVDQAVKGHQWSNALDNVSGAQRNERTVDLDEEGNETLESHFYDTSRGAGFQVYGNLTALAGKQNAGPDGTRTDLAMSFIKDIAQRGPEALTQLRNGKPEQLDIPNIAEMLSTDNKVKWFATMHEMIPEHMRDGQLIKAHEIGDVDRAELYPASSVIDNGSHYTQMVGQPYREAVDGPRGTMKQREKAFDQWFQARGQLAVAESTHKSLIARGGLPSHINEQAAKVQSARILVQQLQQKIGKSIADEKVFRKGKIEGGLSVRPFTDNDHEDKFGDMERKYEFIDNDDEDIKQRAHRRSYTAMGQILSNKLIQGALAQMPGNNISQGLIHAFLRETDPAKQKAMIKHIRRNGVMSQYHDFVRKQMATSEGQGKDNTNEQTPNQEVQQFLSSFGSHHPNTRSLLEAHYDDPRLVTQLQKMARTKRMGDPFSGIDLSHTQSIFNRVRELQDSNSPYREKIHSYAAKNVSGHLDEETLNDILYAANDHVHQGKNDVLRNASAHIIDTIQSHWDTQEQRYEGGFAPIGMDQEGLRHLYDRNPKEAARVAQMLGARLTPAQKLEREYYVKRASRFGGALANRIKAPEGVKDVDQARLQLALNYSKLNTLSHDDAEGRHQYGKGMMAHVYRPAELDKFHGTVVEAESLGRDKSDPERLRRIAPFKALPESVKHSAMFTAEYQSHLHNLLNGEDGSGLTDAMAGHTVHGLGGNPEFRHEPGVVGLGGLHARLRDLLADRSPDSEPLSKETRKEYRRQLNQIESIHGDATNRSHQEDMGHFLHQVAWATLGQQPADYSGHDDPTGTTKSLFNNFFSGWRSDLGTPERSLGVQAERQSTLKAAMHEVQQTGRLSQGGLVSTLEALGHKDPLSNPNFKGLQWLVSSGRFQRDEDSIPLDKLAMHLSAKVGEEDKPEIQRSKREALLGTFTPHSFHEGQAVQFTGELRGPHQNEFLQGGEVGTLKAFPNMGDADLKRMALSGKAVGNYSQYGSLPFGAPLDRRSLEGERWRSNGAWNPFQMLGSDASELLRSSRADFKSPAGVAYLLQLENGTQVPVMADQVQPLHDLLSQQSGKGDETSVSLPSRRAIWQGIPREQTPAFLKAGGEESLTKEQRDLFTYMNTKEAHDPVGYDRRVRRASIRSAQGLVPGSSALWQGTTPRRAVANNRSPWYKGFLQSKNEDLQQKFQAHWLANWQANNGVDKIREGIRNNPENYVWRLKQQYKQSQARRDLLSQYSVQRAHRPENMEYAHRKYLEAQEAFRTHQRANRARLFNGALGYRMGAIRDAMSGASSVNWQGASSFGSREGMQRLGSILGVATPSESDSQRYDELMAQARQAREQVEGSPLLLPQFAASLQGREPEEEGIPAPSHDLSSLVSPNFAPSTPAEHDALIRVIKQQKTNAALGNGMPPEYHEESFSTPEMHSAFAQQMLQLHEQGIKNNQQQAFQGGAVANNAQAIQQQILAAIGLSPASGGGAGSSGNGGGGNGLPPGGPPLGDMDAPDDPDAHHGEGDMSAIGGGQPSSPSIPVVRVPKQQPASSGLPYSANPVMSGEHAIGQVADWIRYGNTAKGLHPLNPAQEQAVTSPDYHKIIRGGPGGGKTMTLVRSLMHGFITNQFKAGNVRAFSTMHSGVSALNESFGSYRKLLPNHLKQLQVPEADTLASLAYSIIAKGGSTAKGHFPAMEAMGRHFTGRVLVKPTDEQLAHYAGDQKKLAQLRADDPRNFLREALIAQGMPRDHAESTQMQGSIEGWVRDIERVKGMRGVGSVMGPNGLMESEYDQMRRAGNATLSGGQGHLGDFSSILAAYEQHAEGQGAADFHDMTHFASRRLEEALASANPRAAMADILPSQYHGTEAVALDEGQDITHGNFRLLQGLMHGAGALTGNVPRLFVGMDPMQSLLQGLGGIDLNHVGDAFMNLMHGTGHSVSSTDLTENKRSDAETVALNNAILQDPMFANEAKSPIQTIGKGTKRGRAPQWNVGTSQPMLYRAMWDSMLGKAGLSLPEMVGNYRQHKNVYHGIDWSDGKHTKPGQIPAIVSTNTQLDLFEKELRNKLRYQHGTSQAPSAHEIDAIVKQMYRRGLPTEYTDPKVAERFNKPNELLFPGLKTGGSRSLGFKYPHIDTTIVGQWLSGFRNSHPDMGNRLSWFRNMFTAFSRSTNDGAQNVLFHATHPFRPDQAEQYLGRTTSEDEMGRDPDGLDASTANAVAPLNGVQVPVQYHDIMRRKDAILAGWGMGRSNATQQLPVAPPASPPPSQGGAGTGADVFQRMQDDYLQTHPDPAGHPLMERAQYRHFAGQYKYRLMDQLKGKTPEEQKRIQDDIDRIVPSQLLSPHHDSYTDSGHLKSVTINAQQAIVNSQSISLPTPGVQMPASSGGGNNFNINAPGNIIGGAQYTQTPPPRGNYGNGGQNFRGTPNGDGQEHDGHGGGPGGGGYNNEESQIGRTLARIGGELQFMGQTYTQMTQQSVQQSSEYRRYTIPLGTPAAGDNGTTGFFDFTQNGLMRGNRDLSGISAYQEQNLQQYSNPQIAAGISSLTQLTGTPFTEGGTLPPLTTMMNMATMAGVDPSVLMNALLPVASSVNGAQQIGYGGQAATASNSRYIAGQLYSMFNGNMGDQNIMPTISALGQMLPTMQGSQVGSYPGNMNTEAMTFLDTALNAGIPVSSFGDVANASNALSGAGYRPNLQQQYQLSKLYGNQNMTANPELLNFQQDQAQRALQMNIDGKGTSFPNLQIQISHAQIQLDQAQLDMSQTQLAYGQANFQEQQYVANQQYGPIGADVSKEAYFSFERNQLRAGYDPTSPESATKYTPSQPFGLKNEEFYAGMEHQRSQLVLGRSPLLSDMAFQDNMKYIDQQENFYKRELDLTNQQRAFEKNWQQKLLDAQAAVLAEQIKMFALEKQKAAYDEKSYAIQNTYLGLIYTALNDQINGNGPVQNRGVQPTDMLQKIATSGMNDTDIKQMLQQLAGSPADANTLFQMVKQIQKDGGGLSGTRAKFNAADDKALNAQAQKMIRGGAYLNDQTTAAQQDAALLLAGVGQKFDAFHASIDAMNGTLKETNTALGHLDAGAVVAWTGGIASTIGGIAMTVGSLFNIWGLLRAFGAGGIPGAADAAGGANILGGGDPAAAVAGEPGAVANLEPNVLPQTGTLGGDAAVGGSDLTLIEAIVFPVALAVLGAIGTKLLGDILQQRSDLSQKDPGLAAKQQQDWFNTNFGWTGIKPSQSAQDAAKKFQQMHDQQYGGSASGNFGIAPHGVSITPLIRKNVSTTLLHPVVDKGAKDDPIARTQKQWLDDQKRQTSDSIKKQQKTIDDNYKQWLDDHRANLSDIKTSTDNANTNTVTQVNAMSLTWGKLGEAFHTVWDKTIKLFSDGITNFLHLFGIDPNSKQPKSTSTNQPSGDLLTWFMNLFNQKGNSSGSGGSPGIGPTENHMGLTTPHVNTEFGAPMWYGRHQGVDFAAGQGTPLSSFNGGKVTGAGFFPWGGEVDVDMGGGLTERYLHLSQIGVASGQKVARGQRIGLTGGGTPQSGLGYWSRGAHSHVQIDKGNINQGLNPWPIWAMMGDDNIASFYGAMGQEASSNPAGPVGNRTIHMYQGGVALGRMRAELAENEPEAVIPLSKLTGVLQQTFNSTMGGNQRGSGTTTLASPSVQVPTKQMILQKIAEKLEVHVHTTAQTLDEHAQDELMSQTIDVLIDAISKAHGKI